MAQNSHFPTTPVVAYNKYMGGVDLSDRKIYHVSAERPSKRYWKKIFFNLVDMALLNSYILYEANTYAPYPSLHYGNENSCKHFIHATINVDKHKVTAAVKKVKFRLMMLAMT